MESHTKTIVFSIVGLIIAVIVAILILLLWHFYLRNFFSSSNNSDYVENKKYTFSNIKELSSGVLDTNSTSRLSTDTYNTIISPNRKFACYLSDKGEVLLLERINTTDTEWTVDKIYSSIPKKTFDIYVLSLNLAFINANPSDSVKFDINLEVYGYGNNERVTLLSSSEPETKEEKTTQWNSYKFTLDESSGGKFTITLYDHNNTNSVHSNFPYRITGFNLVD